MSTVPRPPLNANVIWNWVNNDCPSATVTILKRPSAQSYPNTFVVMWSGTGLPPGMSKICLDVHYEGAQIEGGKPLLALGGLWATGFDGALKPEQHATSGQKTALLRSIGGTAPNPDGLDNYGQY